MRNAQFGVYPFWCKVFGRCIHSVYGHSGADRKGKCFFFLFVRCVCVDKEVKLSFLYGVFITQ